MDIQYRGTHFCGWQSQPHVETVQGEIEKGLGLLLNQSVSVTGSGRTDAGVHANQQIAHFDAPPLDASDLVYKLNAFLGQDIAVKRIFPVNNKAHARFSAIHRTYHYRLHQLKNPFKTSTSYYFSPYLDLKSIEEACEILKTRENFKCFSKVHTEVNHFNCTLYEVEWKQEQGDEHDHLFVVSANRFLRGMVRAMVGTLLDVGQQKTSLGQLKEILNSNDRKKAGRSVSAQGLYLQRVDYPVEILNVD